MENTETTLLKITVSVVRFRPWAPSQIKYLKSRLFFGNKVQLTAKFDTHMFTIRSE
jgi:hypothetical protein